MLVREDWKGITHFAAEVSKAEVFGKEVSVDILEPPRLSLRELEAILAVFAARYRGLREGVERNGRKIIENPRVLKYTLVGRNSRKEIPLDAGFPTRPAVEDISW